MRAWVVRALGVVVLVGTLMAAGGVNPSEQADLAGAAHTGLRYDRALAFYARAQAVAPDDPQPLCGEGRVRMLQQEWNLAVTAYQGCVARDTSSATAWLTLGQALDAAAQSTAAASAYTHAGLLGSHEAQRLLALLDERTGKLADATRAWSALPPADRATAKEAALHLGLLALVSGDHATAASELSRAEELGAGVLLPADATLHAFLALATSPSPTAGALDGVGYALLAMDLPWLALVPLRAAVAGNPHDGAAQSYLGWTYWLLGERTEARIHITAGAHLAPTLSFARFAAGEIAASDGNAQAALDEFSHGLLTDARNPVLWSAVAAVEVSLHDEVAAELADENAANLSTDPVYTRALLQFYVTTHVGLSDGRARQAAEAAVRRFPTDEPVRALNAQLFDLMDIPDSAYTSYLQAVALDPRDPMPYLYLGQAAENEGSYSQAALELHTALALRPSGPLAPTIRNLLAPLVTVQV